MIDHTTFTENERQQIATAIATAQGAARRGAGHLANLLHAINAAGLPGHLIDRTDASATGLNGELDAIRTAIAAMTGAMEVQPAPAPAAFAPPAEVLQLHPILRADGHPGGDLAGDQ